ncbi:Ymc1p [Sugiyamaella lignohabitans]|uniref:Ymc1p n=1 Tax=Sugiyamaella lignohabitans TaxID=796027 RepID=A0A161HJR6_9ASCO|nr:Ymc1p [Sugiyamaella lignohabitans]ANB11708.1 Ymc1p [Sugiyamaella lignohabitans]
MAEVGRPDNSISRKVKDTGAGFVGGAVQVLVGQPFDLVKVRLQTGQFSSGVEAVTQTLKNEGLSAFYKGTTAPLIGVGACVSVQFYAFHEAKRQLLSYNQRTNNSPHQLTYPQFYIAGATAGLANSFIASPVEHLRILIQTQKDAKYKGPFDAAKHIRQKYGIAGLYRGFTVTLLREVQAYGVWFLTFEYLMAREMAKPEVASRKDIPAWKLMAFGGLAGEALWLASYPLDVIKSQVQGHPFGSRLTAIDAAKTTFQKSGIKGFWRGIVPTLLRAIPASASTFASVELTLRLLG